MCLALWLIVSSICEGQVPYVGYGPPNKVSSVHKLKGSQFCPLFNAELVSTTTTEYAAFDNPEGDYISEVVNEILGISRPSLSQTTKIRLYSHSSIKLLFANGKVVEVKKEHAIPTNRCDITNSTWKALGDHTYSSSTADQSYSISIAQARGKLLKCLTTKSSVYGNISIAPSRALAAVRTSAQTPSFDKELALRERSRLASFGSAFEASIGYSFHHTHNFYASYIYLNQGFRSLSDTINWRSGASAKLGDGATTTRYQIVRHGLGVGYRYSRLAKVLHPVVDVGLYGLFSAPNRRRSGSLLKAGVSDGGAGGQTLDYASGNALCVKVAFGFGIRLGYRTELAFIPTAYYNVTPQSGSQISTRLYNMGLNITLSSKIGLF